MALDDAEVDAGGVGPQVAPSAWLRPEATHPIAEVVYRRRAQVGGRIRSVRVRPWGEVPTLEAVVADDTAAITVALLGRRELAGVAPGARITVEGMVGERQGKLVILNPAYDLQAPDPSGS
ncbi:MAG: hypothetical protein U0P45_10995 [Acidimicrobiales bacterium]